MYKNICIMVLYIVPYEYANKELTTFVSVRKVIAKNAKQS